MCDVNECSDLNHFLQRRKTPTAFGFDAQTRQVLTGEGAKTLYFRTPSNALLGIKRLIGQRFDSPHIKTFQEDHPYAKLVKGEDDFVEFEAAEGEVSSQPKSSEHFYLSLAC